jgi:hypothetical protein
VKYLGLLALLREEAVIDALDEQRAAVKRLTRLSLEQLGCPGLAGRLSRCDGGRHRGRRQGVRALMACLPGDAMMARCLQGGVRDLLDMVVDAKRRPDGGILIT